MCMTEKANAFLNEKNDIKKELLMITKEKHYFEKTNKVIDKKWKYNNLLIDINFLFI